MEHFLASSDATHVTITVPRSSADRMRIHAPTPPTAAGTQAHRAIATLLDAGHRSPSPQRIDELIASRTSELAADVNRRAYRQRIGTAVRSYFWHFVLDDPWEFVGAEVRLGGYPIDLVWHNEHRYMFDEIKTSLVTRLALESKANDQSDRYVRLGLEHFADRFDGVRCLPLLDRGAAVLKLEPGIARPLPDLLRRQAA